MIVVVVLAIVAVGIVATAIVPRVPGYSFEYARCQACGCVSEQLTIYRLWFKADRCVYCGKPVVWHHEDTPAGKRLKREVY